MDNSTVARFDAPAASTVSTLLLTGQFWAHDFADLVNGLTVPTTVMRVEQLTGLAEYPSQFEMILVCKERRGSIAQTTIDRLAALWPETPILTLLGSWCEGEARSGYPLRGTTSVQWHQWQGSFDQLQAIAAKASEGKPVASNPDSRPSSPGIEPVVAISALTREQFEWLADGVRSLGGNPVWLEQASWQAQSLEAAVAILVDGDSLTSSLEQQLRLANSLCPGLPLVCTLGFPRKHEVLRLQFDFGVRQVVSKPFEAGQLYHALREATGIEFPVLPPQAGQRRPAAIAAVGFSPGQMAEQNSNAPSRP